jgi:hypothetical protein
MSSGPFFCQHQRESPHPLPKATKATSAEKRVRASEALLCLMHIRDSTCRRRDRLCEDVLEFAGEGRVGVCWIAQVCV